MFICLYCLLILPNFNFPPPEYSWARGRIWRAFWAFPGRPWRRTQDCVGHKTDDKREKKKKKKDWEKGKVCKKKMEEREGEKWTEINGKR